MRKCYIRTPAFDVRSGLKRVSHLAPKPANRVERAAVAGMRPAA
jgi:hypothetical protein